MPSNTHGTPHNGLPVTDMAAICLLDVEAGGRHRRVDHRRRN
jgi:hypothetical protein